MTATKTDRQQASETPATAISSESGPAAPEAERVVRRLIDEVFCQGRFAVCEELIAAELIEHQDYGPDHAPGAAGVKAVASSLRRAFSDFKLEIEDLVVAGDTVWLRNIATGTQDGEYMGRPPRGGRFKIYVFDVLRVVRGRVVEHWGVPDRLGTLVQLGAFAPPARS